MRKCLAALALGIALCAPATAKDINLPLNDREQAVLREILDVATKAGGLSVAQATVHFATKLQQLQQQADQPPPPAAEPPK